MAPEVVDRTSGSKWLSALPTGNADQAAGGGNADQEFSGTLRKTEESGKSNLCFPDSCEDARQQVGVGTAGRQQVGAGSPRVGSADP